MYFTAIYCRSIDGGFGFQNKIPWTIKGDMRFFRSQTINNTIICGKKTFESVKTLSDRNIFVVSKTSFTSLEKSLYEAYHIYPNQKIFVIGGAQLLSEALTSPFLETIYETTFTTSLKLSYDVYFHPKIPNNFTNEIITQGTEGNYKYIITKYTKNIITDETKYIELCKYVLNNGTKRKETISCFSPQEVCYDLKYFPLLTTKKVYWRGVVEELLWFLRGETNSKILHNKGVKIWDLNSSAEVLGEKKLPYSEGECGPIYGQQWRSFGGEFNQNHSSHINTGGRDQILDIIKLLKTDPFSRRILLLSWNPNELDKVVLPACHVCCQFYVHEERSKKILSCKVFQRSCDLFLGDPFNVASYALLTFILAKMCDMEVGRLIRSYGDAHIYLDHIEQIHEQIKRNPRPFPSLKVLVKRDKIEDYKYEDFLLEKYYPNSTIKGKMTIT